MSRPAHSPTRGHRRWLGTARACLLICALWAWGSIDASAQNAAADEFEIRAAMLFNLTKFITWPAWKMDATHPEFDICVLGSDPTGPEIENFMKNKTVDMKPVIVRRLDSVASAGACHVLYVGLTERYSVVRASDDLARNAVLTVSERSNAESPTQLVGLPTLDDHVHIDVNLGAAQRSGLIISSKLLHLATVTY